MGRVDGQLKLLSVGDHKSNLVIARSARERVLCAAAAFAQFNNNHAHRPEFNDVSSQFTRHSCTFLQSASRARERQKQLFRVSKQTSRPSFAARAESIIYAIVDLAQRSAGCISSRGVFADVSEILLRGKGSWGMCVLRGKHLGEILQRCSLETWF